jgi:hypothetical protein
VGLAAELLGDGVGNISSSSSEMRSLVTRRAAGFRGARLARLRSRRGLAGWWVLASYSNFAIVVWMPWTVSLHPQAEAELQRIPAAERVALLNAAQKLEALGPDLEYPHSSAVRDANRLRELRPRAGRSPWRGFYRRFGDVFVLAAVGPEAEADPRGFKRAVVAAERRLEEVEGL